jgi:hypothetical protein
MKKIILFSILIMAMLINSRSNGLDLNYSDKNEKSLFGGLFSTNIRNLLNECIAKFKMSMEKINSELEKINSQNYTNFELASVIYPNDITGYNYNDTTSVYIFNTVTRDNYFGTFSTNCTFTLPFKLKNVLSLSLSSLQLPNVFFAFSAERGTNQIYIYEDNTELSGIVTIPNGNYTNEPTAEPGIFTASIGNALERAINKQILNITDPDSYRFLVCVDPVTNFTRILNTENTFSMKLMVNNLSFMDQCNFNAANMFPAANIDNKESMDNYTPPYSFPDYNKDDKIYTSKFLNSNTLALAE